MSGGNKKFTAHAERMGEALSQLFNRAIRSAMLEGLAVAVKETKHDSSNAAAHWMIAGEDGSKSRPWQRRLGTVRDLRGTSTREPVPPVGRKGDDGKNASKTITFVRERELKEVLDKLIKGHKPEFRFYFYNAVGGEEKYGERANIEKAGNAGVQRVLEAAARRIESGRTRKRTLS